ncbi:NUDIX domain-containing protein [Streptomyces sp. DSM 44917]|uniref:NUDIX domain-containing protein n=1 Tax=Streptomyces boetiae TaxID=3075541 RepID=A0ABU2LFG2_9ACTN|nr:NUDIX domain-containing protein [Streptomyces sp. DSM 44917]MDT0309908.1 NUDIX domain-containing protein [Streptomyces sp. DSM 44917]
MAGIIDTVAWVHVADGRVLAARTRGRSLFYIPGGKREPGESDLQALAREVHEELSVTLVPGTEAHFGTFTAEADDRPAGTLVRMACYTAEHRGEPVASREIEEIAWLSLADRERTPPVDHAVFDALARAGRLR